MYFGGNSASWQKIPGVTAQVTHSCGPTANKEMEQMVSGLLKAFFWYTFVYIFLPVTNSITI